MAQIKSLASSEPLSFIDGDWIESPYITEEGIRLIQTGNIGIGRFRNDNKKYISSKAFDELRCKEVVPGDLLICRLADPIGRVCLVPPTSERMITSVDVIIFKPDEKKALKTYLLYLLNSDKFLLEVNNLAAGSTRQRISRSAYGNMVIDLPPLPVQSKIAHILSTVDRQIEKTEQLIRKYEMVKEGMMQDLFTRGIDGKTGKLRPSFDEAPGLYKESELGWIPKEWEIDSIENCTSIITDFTANGSFESLKINVKYYYEPHYARLIRLTDLRQNLNTDGVFVDRSGYEFLAKSSLKENDILIANVGEYTGFTCLMPKVSYPVTLAPNMFLVRAGFNIIEHFLFYSMTRINFQNQIDMVSASSATKLLNKTNFRAMKLGYPDTEEQQQIVRILQAIDSILNINRNHYQEFINVKAGLMEDLLSGKTSISE